MDIQKKEVSVNLPVAGFQSSAVIDSDAIVSDSKPDLLRILHIDPTVRILKTEIMSGKMMVAGHISYCVLYQPENAEGVHCLNTTADFSHLEENPAFTEGMYCRVSAAVEHIEPELINSRKIKIKSVLSFDINVDDAQNVMLPLDISGDNIQTKYCDFGGFSRVLQKRDIITVSDSLPLPAGKANIGSLLKTDALLCNKDIKVISGKVIIKGDIITNCMYVPEGTCSVDCCSHTMPFTEILDAEGLTEDHLCRVMAEVEECDFSLATDPDGDVRVINASVRVGVRICADMPMSERVITDVYSLTDNLDVKYNSLNLKRPVSSTNFDYTLKTSVRPERISSVYNVNGTPNITMTTAKDSCIALEGYIDLSCLCITADKNCPVINHTEEVPFKIEAQVEGCKSGMEVDTQLEINSIMCNLSPSGEIELKIVLSCYTRVLENAETDIVESIEYCGVLEGKSPSIVLYFVQKGDTLWDIAKRYHTKQEYIQDLNRESANPLECGSQLLIPRG